jgi:hypothetical protein
LESIVRSQSTNKLFGVCVSAAVVATAQAGVLWSPFAGNEEQYQLLTAGRTSEKSVFEVRIGSSPSTPVGDSQWEAGLWSQKRSGGLRDSRQLDWAGNSVSLPFSVQWLTRKTVIATIGDETLSDTNVAGNFSDVFIRARSEPGSSIALSDLRMVDSRGNTLTEIDDLNNRSLFGNSSSYVRIQNEDRGRFKPFTLSGVVTMNWEADQKPDGSKLGFEVRLTDTTDFRARTMPIPTPGGFALLAGAGVISIRRRARKA